MAAAARTPMIGLSQSLPEAKGAGSPALFASGAELDSGTIRAVTRILASISLAALLAAAGAAAAGSPALTAHAWQLEKLAGVSRGVSTVTAQFSSDGRISGFSGCNQYSGTYTASGTSISVSKSLAVTQMACPAPQTLLERVYLKALTTARRYSTAGSSLTLRSRLGLPLATFAVQSQSLAGTKWNVISYNNGKQAVVSVLADTKLTASFDDQARRVSGSAGCNSYSADMKVAIPKIEVGPAATTRKFCEQPKGVMEQESQYLAALKTAATYKIEGTSLELRTKDGAIAADLARA
jgi:heat shock protein HslJ